MSAQLSLGGSLTVSEAAAFVLCLSRSHAFWLALAGTTRYQAGQGDVLFLLGGGRSTTSHCVKFSSHPILHSTFTFLR